uniref:Uncharacterized protein n=1 Tax=Anguilla anguilla TaxID=7936 RepID=A0A0E9T4F1_ANGAN
MVMSLTASSLYFSEWFWWSYSVFMCGLCKNPHPPLLHCVHCEMYFEDSKHLLNCTPCY